jgi:hypothetical protein
MEGRVLVEYVVLAPMCGPGGVLAVRSNKRMHEGRQASGVLIRAGAVDMTNAMPGEIMVRCGVAILFAGPVIGRLNILPRHYLIEFLEARSSK